MAQLAFSFPLANQRHVAQLAFSFSVANQRHVAQLAFSFSLANQRHVTQLSFSFPSDVLRVYPPLLVRVTLEIILTVVLDTAFLTFSLTKRSL